MFSFKVAQAPRCCLWKNPWVVQRLLHVYPCAFKEQNQAYRFSNRYYLSNFLDVQKESFQTFLKEGLIQELKKQTIRVPFHGKDKKGSGLKLVFYPESYRLLEPKLTVKQAMYARKTYSSDLYIPIKIVDERNQSFILDWFCLATLPLMTSNGHFIVNGLPRMIMSQIVRSPGIYFKKLFRSDNPNSAYYTADFIAQRGTWLRLETDLKPGKIWVKMKNEQKVSFMPFFRYIGIASPILSRYYNFVFNTRFEEPEKGVNPLARAYANEGYTQKAYDVLLQNKIQRRFVQVDALGETHYDPFLWIDDRFEEVFLLPEKASQQKCAELFFRTFSTELSEEVSVPKSPLEPIPLMTHTLDWDTKTSFELEQKYDIDEELNPLFNPSEIIIKRLFLELELEQKLRFRNIFYEQFTQKDMKQLVDKFFRSKFLNKKTYNLSLVGRAKLNQTLGLKIPLTHTLLTEYDLLFGALYLVQCATGKKPLSDIDHLMNRKIKPVGELIQNQFAVGLQRFEEFFVEQLCRTGPKKKKNFFSLWQAFSQQIEPEVLLIELTKRLSTYITAQPINTALKEFFGSNPLSQMLDQTNPLAEITHKRRLSSLGIGGVSRQNAGMDIRGIHPTHYGRICPIETPEGQNAGLVNSFTIYSRINSLGFIQTPFYEIYRGFVLREKGPFFFLANQEKGLRIAPGDLSPNSFNFLPKGILLPSRKTKLFERVDRSDLEYIGVHPLQMISIATSLIPFLEHDDGNRALMGSNMQRQSVPTLYPTRPIVGTGLESKVLFDVDHVLQAKQSGIVGYVDSRKICLYSPSETTKKETKKVNSLATVMKQALAKKQKRSSELPLFNLKSTFLKKHPTFNSLCTTNAKPFLSFLSLTQFQKLYQSQLQNDRLGVLQIFEVMENQKTYDSKRKKFIKFKNPFLLALKHHATLDSPQIYLNATFFALQSVGESTAFSFNPCVHYSSKKGFLKLSLKQQASPFAKRIRLKNHKKVITLSFKGKQAPSKAAMRFYHFLNNELRCFFDPTQTTLQTPATPNFFLRTESFPLTNMLPRKHTLFSPLVPQTLFNAPTVYKFQKKIRGQWRKKSFTFKPSFCQSGLINVAADPTRCSNPIPKQPPVDIKRFHHKQIVLQKKLFYQNLPTWLTPTVIQTKEMSYLPLNKAKMTSPHQPLSVTPRTSFSFKKPDLKLMSYSLNTITRSNQDTYLLHRPVVKPGQWVEKGDILADNSSSFKGELAIGKNLLVGYTPWEGYNFEDAVLLSDRVLSQELFTSLHVERYDIEVRDTPDGMEEITTKTSSSKTAHLNSNGVVKVGTWVTAGDILVGKRTPIANENNDGFESLLKSILQENEDVGFRDTSLRVPPNVHGWVVHVEIVETMDDVERLTEINNLRKKIQKYIDLEKKAPKQTKTTKSQLAKQQTRKKATKRNIQNTKLLSPSTLNCLQKKRPHLFNAYHSTCHGFNFSFFDFKDPQKFQSPFLFSSFNKQKNRAVFMQPGFSTLSFNELCSFSSNLASEINHQVQNRIQAFDFNKRLIMPHQEQKRPEREISKETVDFFPEHVDDESIRAMYTKLNLSKREVFFKDGQSPKLLKRVNVYIAEKRVLQVGDKIAGRHGNKGIISTILPQQDMPYLPDGTPLDLVLNPLGVPSRMNVGQIFECLLGLAGSYLHQTYKIQPFDEQRGCEASRSLVYSKLYEARIKTKQNWLFDPNFPGKVRLFDGRTGQCFEQPVTVGKAYILKLIHLVDEKIHARSTGPYSLVTQQPLRGRSNKGGQRVGEMEVWALEGFGAAYILQELLTVKSDDRIGRSRLTKRIVADKPIGFGPPESFRVLLRELESLCVGTYVY